MRYYLAIDIGASSGRNILGHIENGKLSLREIYRFENYIINTDGLLPREELYARNGIQSINFNTIYQLYCDNKSGKLDKAAHFLMIPDYEKTF